MTIEELEIALGGNLDYSVLEDLIYDNTIKYNSKKHKLSLVSMRLNLSKEDIYALILKKGFIDTYTLRLKFRSSIKEAGALLDELIKEGRVVFYKKTNVYAIPFRSTISVKESGNAFCRCEEGGYDVFIDQYDTLGAYNGDLCEVIVVENPGYKNKEGVVTKIIERGHKQVIGKLKLKNKRGKTYLYIKSSQRDFPVSVDVDFNDKNLELVGSIVSADLTYTKHFIYGEIKERLGYPDDPGIEISEIAAEYGFKTPFSAEAMEELDSIPDEVKEWEIKGRRDFRGLNIITIDGDDSKDFDDAVSVEILPNGNYSLGVYIADVSHYVKENHPLDKDALERGTSVYLADRVIPMIPRKLSNGICSLNEGVDRLVLACIMEIDYKGKLVSYDICEGVIKSLHRMTYNKVNKILAGDEALINEYSDIVAMLNNMRELSQIIRELRYKRGGLEFETTEYKFELNEDGSPKSIIKRERADSERMIEDFMLSANETVAYHMNISNLPIVYRVHEKPDQEKLHNVFSAIKSMKVKVRSTKNDIHPKEIQALLEDIKDNPNREIINNMVLRSMMKAKYSEECLGHYGLAMEYYCHFTSPIRRYPDLMTHRMIKKLLLHPNELENDIIKYNSLIPEIAMKNSISERKAIDCERDVDDMLYAWYMQSHIKEKFSGTITSITPFGMFVTLDNGVEGLVAYRSMDGYYYYDEATMSCSNGVRTYKLGKRVEVIVGCASKETRKIDFSLALNRRVDF